MRTHVTSLAVVTVLLLAGCSAGGGESAGSEPASESADGGGAVGMSQDDVAAPEAAEEEAGGDAATEDGGTAAEDRSFVVSGSIAVTVEDPREAAGEAATLVEETGGFVQERTIDAGGAGDPASAYLMVRIPSDDVTAVVMALEDLGELDHMTEQSIEVTEQVVDVEGRVRAMELSITRLEEVLATSTSVDEVLEAERLLTERQAELELLLSEQEELNEEIDLATFEITLWSPGQAPEAPAEPEQGFWPSLVRSWDALVSSLGGVLTVLGAVLPWAVFFGLIGWGLLAVRRWWQRRMAERGYPGRPGPAATLPPYGGPGSGPVRFPAPPSGQGPQGQPGPQGPQGQPEHRPAEETVGAGRHPAPPA